MMFFYLPLIVCLSTSSYGDLVSQDNLKLLWYTPENPGVSVPLQNADFSSLSESTFQQLKIIMHGWNDNTNSAWCSQMRDAYLQQGHSVILIDWSYYSTNVNYWSVIIYVQGVGNIIGNLAIEFLNTFGVQLSDVECIGHSLGAHGCGFAGKFVYQNKSEKVGNITGLDPAGPGYEGAVSTLRLDETDADIVKVLHTNAGGEGITQAIGQADFYPNGGSLQSNCLAVDTNCSHTASIRYWITGISSDKYVGTQCSLYTTYQLGLCRGKPTAIMGEDMDASASGVYYLTI